MKIKAESKFIRTSPRKIRLVADLVRGMSLDQAFLTLDHLPNRAAINVSKTLKQAVANAVNNHNLAKASLAIHSIEVNEGPTNKRWRPVSRGRAHSIFKRASHIKIILVSEDNQSDQPKPTNSKVVTKQSGKNKQPKNIKINK